MKQDLPVQHGATFVVARGASVTAWALSPISERYYPGEPSLAEDRVNYRFINGFVDVGTLPCRVALFRELAEGRPMLETDWEVESLHLPGANRRVEFSRFRHRPTRLARWCRTILVPPADGDYRFDIVTCGGVHIWVDGQLQASFEPYTRNKEQRREIALPLRAAGSEVVVLTEEMAERDTNWYFELSLVSDVTLEVRLPGAVAPADSAALKVLADSVRPEGEFVGASGLTLVFDTPAAEAVAVKVTIQPTSHAEGAMLERALELPAGASALQVCKGGVLPDGYHLVELVFTAGAARVTREIGCAVLAEASPTFLGADLGQRKRVALDHAASHGEGRMGTALALLATGRQHDARLRPIFEATLEAIEQRRDCSDFVLVPLLWALKKYGELVPADLAARARRAVLDYRYWVDEPGNDVRWFWSENHVLCFHVSQLLAGEWLGGERFSASGRLGREQAELGRSRLGKWFDAVEHDGLAEWNSAAYYPIDFIGLLALAELADGAVAERARALLDQLFAMIALHTLGGVPSGSMGRAYDKELRAGPLTELAPFAAVAFGRGWLNTGVAALPQFLLAQYAPPADLVRYAEPAADEAFEAHYVQGHGEAARLALYKSANVQLSSTVDGRPGAGGHQQHVMDVRFASHPFARAWINHPGEDDPWGQGRPSYWAGNGVLPRVGQAGNVSLMLYDLGERARIKFTHAYLSSEGIDQRLVDGRWLIARAGNGLVAFGATGPISAVTQGPGAGREYRVSGTRTGWATIVADGSGPDAFEAFRRHLARIDLDLDPDAMVLTLRQPDRQPLVLDWHRGLMVDDVVAEFPNRTGVPKVAGAKPFRI
jgi:hypothetical protein